MSRPPSDDVRLPGALPGRVEQANANHLADIGKRSPDRDDSYALVRSSLNAPAPVGPIAIERVRRLMTDRELAVLVSVDRFRYLTAAQIQQLHFADHATPETAARIRRRVLKRLVSAQMLVQMERRIGGVRAGSTGHVYRIGALGYRLVHDHATMSGRVKEPSPTFLDHTLAVAQLAIDLMVAGRQDDRQGNNQPGGFEITAMEAEPECWRSFQKGLSGTEVLKPDLFVALGLSDYEDRWFIEMDRGTESTTAVVRKCKVYIDYLRSGVEQERYEVFPKVLWIVPTTHRRNLLEGALKRSQEVKVSDIFVVVTSTEALDALIGGAP